MSPSREGVAFCRGYPVGPRSAISIGHQSQMLQGCHLCASSCCGGSTNAVGKVVGRDGPLPEWLQGVTMNPVGSQVGRSDPWPGRLWV